MAAEMNTSHMAALLYFLGSLLELPMGGVSLPTMVLCWEPKSFAPAFSEMLPERKAHTVAGGGVVVRVRM